jgi:hypothetical protein
MEWIERFYNLHRRHTTMGNVSPITEDWLCKHASEGHNQPAHGIATDSHIRKRVHSILAALPKSMAKPHRSERILDMSSSDIRTHELANWRSLADEEWPGLLVGNGASRAVWSKFEFDSLFEAAKSASLPHSLSVEDIALFTELATTNFELVLSALASAQLVAKALGQDSTQIDARYASIRRALVDAVHAHHVAWVQLSSPIKAALSDAILGYSVVYSTNYDLLLYWAVNHVEGSGFKDYFWSSAFDANNTDVWGKCTRLLFLHGGLHLYSDRRGRVIKRRAKDGVSLLDAFATPESDETGPLFVAEGTAEDKLAAILQSPYLSFAYSQLKSHKGPLVIFGHSLGTSDSHLVDAIRLAGPSRVAISIRRETSAKVIGVKAAMKKHFPSIDLEFFDAATHPLGATTLDARSP